MKDGSTGSKKFDIVSRPPVRQCMMVAALLRLLRDKPVNRDSILALDYSHSQVQPDFSTDTQCVATYKGAPFTTSAGLVKVASIVGASIK